jgi:hypothetical protein
VIHYDTQQDGNFKDTLYCLINNIHLTGKIPDDFKISIMMSQQKRKLTKCEEYRILSILTHTSKILTRVILGRMEKKADENLVEDQFDFRKNRGTRETNLCL